MRHFFNKPRSVLTACLVAANIGGAAQAQASDETQIIPVTIDNFVRAASDFEFEKYVSLAGGVNNFFHFRAPLEIDNQPTVRMNRDTLYRSAIVDISKGATLTLPDVGCRMSETGT